MGHRGESTSMTYTLKAIGIAMAILLLLILGAIWFGPEKPELPPVSEITFEPPPVKELPHFEFDSINGKRSSRAGNEKPPEEVVQNIIAENGHWLRGHVTDSKTWDPIEGVLVQILWERTTDETESYEKERNTVLEESDDESNNDIGDAISSINSRLGNHITTTTNPDGSFEIQVPENRELTVQFKKHRYIPASFENVYFEPEDEPGLLDAVLSNGASISGKVSTANKSIEGIYIRINRSVSGNLTDRINENIDKDLSYIEGEYTDEDGQYKISGLEPGSYEVDVVYKKTRYKPDRTLPFQRVDISYEDEVRQNVNFSLTRGGLVWGYTRDPGDQSPIDTNLFLVGPENMITQGLNAIFTAALDGEEEVEFFGGRSDKQKNGYYEIVGIPLNREWRVYALSNDRAPQLSDPFILTRENPDVRIDMNMFDGTSVFGTIVDTKGRPVNEAEVICVPQFSEILSPFNSAKTFREDQSSIDGTFVLDDIPAGSYQIFAFKQGYKYTARGEPIFPDGYKDITNVRITLIPSNLGDHTIFGQITDSQGQAVSGAKVSLGGGSLTQMQFSDQTTETNARGEYQFDRISLGKYMMNIEKEGFPNKTVLKVYLDKPTDVVLNDSIRISGRVLVRETNRPPNQSYHVAATPIIETNTSIIKSIEQAIESSSFGNSFGAASEFQEPDGSFELFLTAGKYTLRASSEDFVQAKTTITVEPGQPLTGITLYISSSGSSIEGYVQTSDGTSPQGANVVLTNAGNGILDIEDFENISNSRSYRVGSDGYFKFVKLPPGEYKAHARHSGYANGESNPIELGELSRVNGVMIRLSQGGTLEGYVYSNNRPVPNAMVIIISANSPASTNTDANGYYYFDGLSPGIHEVAHISSALPDIDIFNPESTDVANTNSVQIEEGKVTRFDIQN